jgi:UDP-N-acetylglucosamine:LPS N-acetylglucosamine transferase
VGLRFRGAPESGGVKIQETTDLFINFTSSVTTLSLSNIATYKLNKLLSRYAERVGTKDIEREIEREKKEYIPNNIRTTKIPRRSVYRQIEKYHSIAG